MRDQTNIYGKILSFFMVMVVLGSMSGCFGFNPFSRDDNSFGSQPAAQLANASESIQDNGGDILTSQEKIRKSAGNINDTSGDLLKKVEDPASREDIYTIQDESNAILSESLNSSRAAGDILDDSKIVDTAGKVLEQTEEDLREYEADGAAEARKNLYKMILGMAATGGLIMAGGIILSFFNPRLGAMVVGFGLIITTIATAGTYYLKWIALIGFVLLGIGLLVTVGFLVRSFWYARHLEQANEVNVDIIEDLKEDLPEDSREEFFGDDGILNQRHTKATRSVVQKTRSRIEKKKNKTKKS